MKRYALGLDFGTNSCRSLVVDLDDGTECGSVVFDYPSGAAGILLDQKDPNVARQNPQDYLDALVASVRGALEEARAADRRTCQGGTPRTQQEAVGWQPSASRVGCTLEI